MIKGIQDDTGKAVESMHAGTKEVEEGVKLSREAGEALEKIVTSVQNVTEMIQQISAAVEEQSSASGDIINSISDVSSITSKNSDNAQASSEAILDLNSMASELHELVSEFKLDQTREDRAGNVGLNQLNSPEPGEEGDTTNV
jgi:methyl-accepting chemotaxis protein